jgi:outer membrane protein assembly factor BamD (BamD/ComL family)
MCKKLTFLAITVLFLTLFPYYVEARDVGLNAAEILFLKEDYDGAIRECNNLLTRTSRWDWEDDAYYLKGLSFLKKGDPLSARLNFEKVLSKYHRSNLLEEASLGLADAYLLEGNFEHAITLYNDFLSRFPESPLLCLAYFRLGQSYQKKGEWLQAEKYLKRVGEDFPLSFEAKLAGDALKEESYFTIQVGSFVDKNNASDLYEELSSKGYPVYISEVERQDKVYYRVRVGKLNTREEVESLERKLAKEGYPTKIYP